MSNISQHIVLSLISCSAAFAFELQLNTVPPALSAPPLPGIRLCMCRPGNSAPLARRPEGDAESLQRHSSSPTLNWGGSIIKRVFEQINLGGLIFKILNSDLEP